MRLGLDFVRRPVPFSRSGAALLLGGILTMAFSVQQLVKVNAETAALRESQAAAAAAAERARGRPQLNAEQLKLRIRLANQVVQKRSVPWDALFRDIEAASDKDVAVLSIQPDTDGRVLRITGEARNPAALAGYISRLEQRPSLARVYLAEHESRLERGQPLLRFGLNATWTPQ